MGSKWSECFITESKIQNFAEDLADVYNKSSDIHSKKKKKKEISKRKIKKWNLNVIKIKSVFDAWITIPPPTSNSKYFYTEKNNNLWRVDTLQT